MQFRIGIEDLAANALIEVLQKDKKKRFLTYGEIEEYGAKVVNILENQNKKVVLVLSRNNTEAFFKDYSDFFEEDELNSKKGISLKTGVQVEDLIRQFRGYLSFSVLLAFVDKAAVKVLTGE